RRPRAIGPSSGRGAEGGISTEDDLCFIDQDQASSSSDDIQDTEHCVMGNDDESFNGFDADVQNPRPAFQDTEIDNMTTDDETFSSLDRDIIFDSEFVNDPGPFSSGVVIQGSVSEVDRAGGCERGEVLDEGEFFFIF